MVLAREKSWFMKNEFLPRRNFQTLMLFAVFSFSFVINAEKDFYRAAALELVQLSNASYPPAEIPQLNLEVYEIAAKTAAKNGADIIVFPETGLLPFVKPSREWMLNVIEDIPDPNKVDINPCKEQSLFHHLPILRRLSCLARNNHLWVVANTVDFTKCDINSNCIRNKNSKNCTSCPDDGYFLYNTNVVFNRDGKLVTKYYKRHLFFEAEMNIPDIHKHIYFDTEFGKFTTVICFDLIFKEAAQALKEPGVLNIAYPTYWFDHTPLTFFSMALQQAWSMANNVNLIAANVHFPPTGSIGSGIYSPKIGALVYTSNPDGRSKLLISDVPTRPDSSTYASDFETKKFFIENGKAVPIEGEETSVYKKECSTTVLGDPKNLTDFRCNPTTIDHYQFEKLKKHEDDIEVCDNNFCCSLSYQVESMDEEYFFGVTAQVTNVLNIFQMGSQTCFIARCQSVEGKACTNFLLKSSTIFRRVEIKGNFSTDQILPYAIDSGVRLTKKDKWSFDKTHMTYSNSNKQSSLLFFGLQGRLFDQDADIYIQSNKAPYLSSIGNLLMFGFCLSITLVIF